MPPCGTFCYRGVVPSTWPNVRRWSIHDASDAVRTPAKDTLRGARLVGLNPTVEVEGEAISLTAKSRQRALARTAVFPFNNALVAAMTAGDELWLVRTNTADLGVSLIRARALVFAVGAVSQVPIGARLRVAGGGDPIHAVAGSRLTGEASAPRVRDTWVDVELGNQSVRLRRGDRAVLGTYEAFVLAPWQDNRPGTHEIAALVDSNLLALAGVIPFLPKISDPELFKMRRYAKWFQWFWGR